MNRDVIRDPVACCHAFFNCGKTHVLKEDIHLLSNIPTEGEICLRSGREINFRGSNISKLLSEWDKGEVISGKSLKINS